MLGLKNTVPCYNRHVAVMNRCNARRWTHEYAFRVAGLSIDDDSDLEAQNTVDSAGDSAVNSIVSSAVDSVIIGCH